MADQTKLLWEDLVEKFHQLQKLGSVPFDVVRASKKGIEILLNFPENKPQWHTIAWNNLSEKVEWYQWDKNGQLQLVPHDEAKLKELLAVAGIQMTIIGLRPPPKVPRLKLENVTTEKAVKLTIQKGAGNQKAHQALPNCCCASRWSSHIHSVFDHMTPEVITYERMKPSC